MNISNLYPALGRYVAQVLSGIHEVAAERRQLLKSVAEYLRQAKAGEQESRLLFVCTHNSRRSMFAQVWAQLAAEVFEIKNFNSFSAGSEATALHPNTAAALKRAGFQLTKETGGENPLYKISFSETAPAINLYSKTAESNELPAGNFAAVLVCVEDAEACPFIPNADARFPLSYSDPKKFDGTAEMEAMYDRCCSEIALEMLWVMKELASTKP
jgi:protein-tyrosine-phosphatase